MWILLDPVGSRADPAQLSLLKFTDAPYETTTFVPGPTPSLQMWILLDPVGSRADPTQLSSLEFTEAPYETTTFAPRPAIAPNVDPPGSRRIPRGSRSAFPS